MSRKAPLTALFVLAAAGAAFAQGREEAQGEVAPGYATDDDPRHGAQDLFDVILPAAPAVDEVEAARRELGAMLFFDPPMSSSGLREHVRETCAEQLTTSPPRRADGRG